VTAPTSAGQQNGKLRLVLDGLQFAECPRWHDGRLWFSDIFAHRVMAVDEAGNAEVVVQLDEAELPAGLGFLPDGRLLIANLARPVLLRREPDGSVVTHADLGRLAVGPLNDMVVDRTGRAYVGASGVDDFDAPRPLTGTGSIIRVDPDGTASIAAPDVDAPNGPVITADGRQYIVASVPARSLTGYDVHPDGSLSGGRIWADLAPGTSDGLAVDSQDGAWTCWPQGGLCRRVVAGGQVTDVIAVPGKMPIAPCLGGPDGRTLFILSVITGRESIAQGRCKSVIESIRVEVPA
jgi:sugar lactone lactonase YvrE